MLPTKLLLGGISDSTPSEFDRVTPPGCRETKRLSELSAGLNEAQALFTANQKVREQELAALRNRRAVDAKFFLADPICWTQARQYLLPAKWFDLAFRFANHGFTVEERPNELVARLTRAQEPLDATANLRAHEKSVFGVNFQDVSESVDAL